MEKRVNNMFHEYVLKKNLTVRIKYSCKTKLNQELTIDLHLNSQKNEKD